MAAFMSHVSQFPPHSRSYLRCTAGGDGQRENQMHFDPAPVRRIYAHKDRPAAEDLICRCLEDIAHCLDELQAGLGGSRFDRMVRPARRIALIAQHLGLCEVAVSARHVRNCLHQNDGIAIEATLARLERGFDLAVNAVWSLRD